MKIIVSVLLVILLLSSACSTSLVEVPLPELDGVTEVLGYSLAPTHMPEDFEFNRYDVTEFGIDSIATISYGRLHPEWDYDSSYQEILIMYPLSFSSSPIDNQLVESLLLKWQRPDDAVLEVRVNGEKAYIVHGSWSAESLLNWVNPDPEFLATYTPEWGYDMYLSLYCDYKLPSGETVGVTIRAIFHPSEGITTTELVKTAESIQLIN